MTEVKTGVCGEHAKCAVCFTCQIEDDVIANVPFVLVNKLWTCFCKYFHLTLAEWEDIVTLYLNSKQLPFCTKCRNTVAELFVLDEKLDSVRKKINRLHSSLTTTIIDTSSPLFNRDANNVNSVPCDAWKGGDDNDKNKEKGLNEPKANENGETISPPIIKLIKQEPKPIIPHSPEIDKRLIELRENIFKRYNPKLVLVNCKDKKSEEDETLSKHQQTAKSASLTFLENFRKNLNTITKPGPVVVRSVSLKRTTKPYVPKKVQIQKRSSEEDLNKNIHNSTNRLNHVNDMNSNSIQVKIENHYGNILNTNEESGALVPFPPSSSDAVDPFQETNDNYFVNENTQEGDNFENYEEVNNYFIPEMEGNLWTEEEEESSHVLNEAEEEEELGGDQVIEQDGIFHYGIWTYVQLEEDESFRCLKCGGSQNSHSKMIQHIQLEHKFKNLNNEMIGEESIEEEEDGNSSDLIKCLEPGCNKSYRSQNGLALHRRTAHSNFHYVCPEPECQRTLTQKHSLLNHLKSFHPTLSLPQEYFDSLNLRRRSKAISTDPSTSSSSLINNEMNSGAVNKENKPYKCTESGCNKSYSTYTGLYIHKRHSHGVVKPYSCTLCPRSFAHEGFLNVHLQNAHLQDSHEHSSDPVFRPKYSSVGKFKCKEPGCGKSYKSYQGLYTHRLLHASSEVLRTHKCPVCSRSFSSKGYLRFHLKVLHQMTDFPDDDEELTEENETNNGGEENDQQTSAPPLKRKVGRPKSIKVTLGATGRLWHCQVPNCGKTYNSYQGLYIHRRHHSSIKPFSCTICNKQFIQKAHLIQHYKAHHVGEMLNEGEDGEGQQQEDSNWDPSSVIQNRIPMKRPYRKRGSLKIGDDWVCSFPGCGRLYKSYQGMYLHRRAHDEEVDETSTAAAKTVATVKTYSKKVKQRGLHKEGETFKCTHEGCEKEYKSYQGLYIHMKMHTGDSIKCPEGCGKEFYQKQNLQYHLTHKHGYKNFKAKNVKKTKRKRGRPKTKGNNWKNWNMNYKGTGTDDENDEDDGDDAFFQDEDELIMN